MVEHITPNDKTTVRFCHSLFYTLVILRFTMNKKLDPVANAVYATANKVHQLVNDLCKTLAYSDVSNYGEVALALQMCEDSFSKEDNVRFNSIFEHRKHRS